MRFMARAVPVQAVVLKPVQLVLKWFEKIAA